MHSKRDNNVWFLYAIIQDYLVSRQVSTILIMDMSGIRISIVEKISLCTNQFEQIGSLPTKYYLWTEIRKIYVGNFNALFIFMVKWPHTVFDMWQKHNKIDMITDNGWGVYNVWGIYPLAHKL